MRLLELCVEISCNNHNLLDEESHIGSRIVLPEYSLYIEDKKTFPLSQDEQIFALCWVIQDNKLWGTIKPSAVSFSYMTTFNEGSRTQMHTHDYLELAYIVSGTFHQRILGKDIVFRQGDLCLVDMNCLHQDCLDPNPACIIFIGIAGEMFNSIMPSQVADERIISFLQTALLKQKKLWQYLHFKPTEDSNKKMEGYFYDLLKELIHHDMASTHICRGLLMRIFKLLGSGYDISLSSEMKKKMNWLLYEEIISYINIHFRDVSIKQLSEHFHFHEDYFNRMLKSKTGMTYTQYVQNLRLREAERLLLHTDLTIDEVAAKVGYQNKGYFYKIFVERNNITPAKYRKEILK
ncbi:MAG: AraC family transcriptional regulator [Clostridiales bacterium]|jgi:AraC-like DNA-binding protein/mannose-6-phosphate isomerase-like protein (cupin superfamily)|nr:AraC family transcriptional regulator [Bacillota bacterium]NLK02782.1 AraC family transcriptional regulator [Clostridiales bacterium]